MVCAMAGVSTRPDVLKKKYGDTTRGLTVSNMKTILEDAGFSVQALRFDTRKPDSFPHPGIVLTDRGHYLLLGRRGESFWQHESYDHWVRSERELRRIVAYIEENPVSAGMADTSKDWPWSSANWAS